MYQTLCNAIAIDKDYPERTHRLICLQKFLAGEIYDHLQYSFQQEETPSGEYIPLRERRPSVRYNLASTVVNDSVSLLFSEGHFPEVETSEEGHDRPVKKALNAVVREAGLNETMLNAATRGSVGSVAVLFRVLSNRCFFSVLTTEYLTPVWKPQEPDVLERVVEMYKVTGAELAAAGIEVSDADSTPYWWRREWTETEESYFQPLKVSDWRDGEQHQRDEERTVQHGLEFVPIVWIHNLPGGSDVDGACTFAQMCDTQIEIEYLLSQGSRGLKYSSDPLPVIKDPLQDGQGTLVKGGGNALVVGEKGDVKLLEISGEAATTIVEFCRALREAALEVGHGNRTAADRISAATSGRAMELMNQALIWLADRLRISYGEKALRELLSMVVRASAKYPLRLKSGEKIAPMDPATRLSLRWPDWYQPTNEDKQQLSATLKTHTEAGHMSEDTATRTIAAIYDIEDVEAERKKIEAERVERLEEEGKAA